MALTDSLQIACPIRGLLKVKKKSKDGLSPSEEFYRVEAIKYLLDKGYPKENFWIEPIIKRFGNAGRNSFRSDFAVLDIPARGIRHSDTDELLSHAVIICEVKKDSAKNQYVKETQVKPMLDFAKKQSTLGLYWDNVDKRVFWLEFTNGMKEIKEGPLSFLPSFGLKIRTKPLTFNTIEPASSLTDVFGRIENILHQAAFSPEKRYEIILQLLLAKIFDEHAFESRDTEPLEIQDYKSLGSSPEVTRDKISSVIERAVSFYGRYLPNKVSSSLQISGQALYDVLQILAPVKIIHSKRDVIQTFYMKFAKDLYKWDMAQYFTPTSVTDFLIGVINPQFGEHIADPACGSADFLVAAFRSSMKYNRSSAECVWGIDNSSNAVQVAVLNMLLNGDGKTNIKQDDSLEHVGNYLEKFDILACNPPFGTRILEKRPSVLRQYDLGYEWELDGDKLRRTDRLLAQQETGVLFIEVCVKECRRGGRIAIILPNGYLGNRSIKYRAVREWILRHTRIAAIISLPRFTFKSSGADVSASVLYLEKREKPLDNLAQDADYCFAVELIEKVGWNAGDKKAAPIYKRNPEDGSLIIGDDGMPVADCDFDNAARRIASSSAAACFGWLSRGKGTKEGKSEDGWAVPVRSVYDDADLTLDPKRYGEKVVTLRANLEKRPHVCLGDIVDFFPEKRSLDGKKIAVQKSKIYHYVEIQDIGFGEYHAKELRGWELPGRARHFSEEGDIYMGSIWGSAVKWCYIPAGAKDVVVTNGCFRCRIREGQEGYLTDLLAYLNSEGWGVQMRSFARGSDGLAEICEEDAKKAIIPLLSKNLRESLKEYVENLKTGSTTLNLRVKHLIKENALPYDDPMRRSSHIVLV